MSFDPRSLERLRELGRQLPQKLPDPGFLDGHPKSSPQSVRNATGWKRNRILMRCFGS